MPLVPQTAAATWRVLCAWFACDFPLVLSLTLFKSSGVFLLFFPARSFQVSAKSPAGGARQFVSSSFFSRNVSCLM